MKNGGNFENNEIIEERNKKIDFEDMMIDNTVKDPERVKIQEKIIELEKAGIFDKDVEKGYEEISKLTQKIFDEIQKIGIIDDKFEILPEAEWEFPEEQPIPFYVSFIYINIVYEKDYRTDADNWINGGD